MAKSITNPELRFAGFTEDWEEKDFEKVFSNISNNSLSREKLNYVNGLAKNVHYGDILVKFNDVLDVRKEVLPYVSDNATVEKLKNSFLKDGDIIISDAAEDETVGKCVELYNVNDEKILSGLHTIAVRPKESFAPKYLGYYMNSNSYHDQLLKLMQGTKVLSVSKTAIKKTVIRNPKSKDEQKLIGNFFENIDKLITEHQQKHSKLKALKQAMLDKMFPKQGQLVPEIRFKGFEEDWENPRLGNIGDPYTGLSGKSKNDFGHGEGRYITYMNVFSNPISDNDEVDKIEIDSLQNEVIAGDVLFTVSSETAAEVGMSSVWTGNQKNIYLNSFCFGYRPKIKLDNYFLANLLRTKAFREQMILLAQGISRYNISKNKVMNLTISIPRFDEQVVIGEYFKNLDSLISQHNEQITKLSNLKKAFLAKMFV